VNLVCAGISHNTAPLEMRERIWFSPAEIRAALPHLRSLGFSECVLFSTCNRTELYAFSDQGDPMIEDLVEFLRSQKQVKDTVPASNFFSHVSGGAAEHLFRVAAGIDSMIVGDVQILAQVKEGYALARESGSAGFFMNKLFQQAFHVGKRSRGESLVSEGAISVSHAAVELAQRIFDDLSRKKALIIGAGETAQLTAKHLLGEGIGSMFITNRTAERAENLARMVGGTAIPFDTFCDRLNEIDIIISSVQTDRHILTSKDIRTIDKTRSRGPLFIIDLGVPRNVDPFAKEIENVFLYDLDNLNMMVSENIAKRREEVPKIQAIIGAELAELSHWHASLEATPTIAALTEFAERIRSEEVAKNLSRFEEKDRELLESISKRIVNRILHAPITNLRNGHDSSISDRLQKISAIRKLFSIDSEQKENSHGG
jgi:glutamyl-tRNA reductase